jgi:hypothetical protein
MAGEIFRPFGQIVPKLKFARFSLFLNRPESHICPFFPFLFFLEKFIRINNFNIFGQFVPKVIIARFSQNKISGFCPVFFAARPQRVPGW